MARFSPLVMIRSIGSMLAVSGLVFAVASWGEPASAEVRTTSAHYTVVIDQQLTGSTGNGAGMAQPEAFAAIKAALGKGVTVDICDNKGTSTGNIDCEHQAISEHAAVFVPLNANLDQSLVDQAGIPVVGVANDTAPQSFDISAQQGLFVGMGVALAKKGCKRLGVVIDEGGQAYAAQTAHAAKWQSVTDAFIPLAAPDLTPDIAKLVQAHVQCVAAASLGSQIPQILTAMQQEHLKVPTALPGIILTSQVVKSLGSLSNGLIAVESTPSPTSAAVANVTKKMHAVNKGIKVDSASLTGWAAAKFIADGAAEVQGPVTSASMLAGLNKLRSASTDGLLPPLSTAPQAKASDRRDFDTYVQSFVLRNGKRTAASGYFNILPQLNAVSS
jgi:hypothetical protein